MAELLNTHVEIESLGGGRFRQTIHVAPIAYDDGGVLKRIDSNWGDSNIPERPSMVSASQLMATVADDGDLRVHPTREDSRYFEFGAPLINVGGEWVRPGFRDRVRDGNTISWTSLGNNETAFLTHAGHYIKWGIQPLKKWDRWSQFAMPVGLTGLTREGGQLFADGEPVMHLRKPVVYDLDNPLDVRQIAHEFVQQAGQWYALFTLPDLTGMSRPLVDPTLELQPDEASGKDALIYAGAADTNYGSYLDIAIGWWNSGVDEIKGLLQFDISEIPSDSTITSSDLQVRLHSESDVTARDIAIYRGLVEWWEGTENGADPGAGIDGCTWNDRNNNGSVA